MLRDMLVGGGKAHEGCRHAVFNGELHDCCALFIEVTVMTVILFIATILSLQEMEDIRCAVTIPFSATNLPLLGGRLTMVGSAWLKTQGSIMFLTMCICTAGLFLMGNQYSLASGNRNRPSRCASHLWNRNGTDSPGPCFAWSTETGSMESASSSSILSISSAR